MCRRSRCGTSTTAWSLQGPVFSLSQEGHRAPSSRSSGGFLSLAQTETPALQRRAAAHRETWGSFPEARLREPALSEVFCQRGGPSAAQVRGRHQGLPYRRVSVCSVNSSAWVCFTLRPPHTETVREESTSVPLRAFHRLAACPVSPALFPFFPRKPI